MVTNKQDAIQGIELIETLANDLAKWAHPNNAFQLQVELQSIAGSACRCKNFVDEVEDFPDEDVRGLPRTAWSVVCTENAIGEDGCGRFYLTKDEYGRALAKSNQTWRCPSCRAEVDWDDDNHMDYTDSKEPKCP